MTNKKYFFYIFILNILSIFFIYNNLDINNSSKLSWDEVDYVNASNKGIFENIYELSSDNFLTHIFEGYNKILNTDNINIIKEIDIESYKLENDVFKLRHYHPPLMNILISSYYNLSKIDNDINLYYFKQFSFSIALFLFSIIFYFFKSRLNNFNLLILILLLSIFFQSKIFTLTLSKLNYHTFFGFIIFFYIYSFFNYAKLNTFKNFLYLSITQTTLLFSLETGIFVIIIPFIYFYVTETSKIYNKFFIISFLKSFILSLIFLLIIWPANIYNLSLLKTYSMYFYRIFIKSADEYSDLHIFETLSTLIFNNYLLVLIFLIFSIYLIINYKKIKNEFIFLLFITIVVYFLFILPFTHHSAYLFPIFTLIIIFCILSILNLSSKYLLLNFILVSIFFIISNYTYFKPSNFNNLHTNDDFDKIINYIDYNLNKKYLIDGAHIFDYYSKNKNLVNLEVFDKYNPSFYIKNDQNYYNIDNLISQNYFKAIIIQKNRNYKKSQLKKLLEYGYNLDNRYSSYYFFTINEY